MRIGIIPTRQVAIWLFFLVLIGVIIGLERSNDDELKPKLDSHGHVISETRMLLPLPAEQFGIVEIAYQGSVHRFERDQAGAWFYHIHVVNQAADQNHTHQPDPTHAKKIEEAFAAFARTRVERQFALSVHTAEYGVIKPEIVIMVYRPDQLKPDARYAVGNIAPDNLSRYILISGSFTVVTIPDYQIENLLTLIKTVSAKSSA